MILNLLPPVYSTMKSCLIFLLSRSNLSVESESNVVFQLNNHLHFQILHSIFQSDGFPSTSNGH